MADIEITEMTREQEAAIGGILGAAFAENPLTGEVAEKGGRYVGVMLGSVVVMAMSDAGTAVLGARADGVLAGIAVVVPGKWEPSRGRLAAAFWHMLWRMPLGVFKSSVRWMVRMRRALVAVGKRDDELELMFLAVRPEMRGRGLGRALVERACALAAQRGLKALRLEAVAGTPAVGLYSRLGFRCVSDFTAGGRVVHVMRRAVAQGGVSRPAPE
jgi:ribosomal protein S18 acetylase RimI-like enzyme